jgi:lipopolysaccharide/colanic/teichoic acid biosynthesis glycosyltransferase
MGMTTRPRAETGHRGEVFPLSRRLGSFIGFDGMAPQHDTIPRVQPGGPGAVWLRGRGVGRTGVGTALHDDLVLLRAEEFEALTTPARGELQMHGPAYAVGRRERHRAKRLFDVLCAITLLPLALLPMLLAAVAVMLDSSGPAMFTQYRVGRDGRLFRFHKLRTMCTDGDELPSREYMKRVIQGGGPESGLFKLPADARITRVGRVLRRFSIDELPQLWNVLRGEMSMVGPRPPLPFEVALYDERAWRRLLVRPGITGPWQVGGRSTVSFETMIDLDLAYVTATSLRRDLAIVARTPIALLAGRGAA